MTKELDYIAELEKENKLLGVINNQDVKIADLEKKLEQTEKDLAEYQFNYPKIKELEKENEELKRDKEDLIFVRNAKADHINELKEQIEKMKKYIKACWVEENLNDYSSYITNSSDEFRDLVKELNDEVRNGR